MTTGNDRNPGKNRNLGNIAHAGRTPIRKSSFISTRKVAVIGAGNVGASIAYALALRDIAREIVLIDVDHQKCIGEAEDIRHGVAGMGTADLYAGTYADCADCDLIIITAGRGRLPGETRLDLAGENVRIMRSVIDAIGPHYTRGVLLVISNPVDILTLKAAEWMGLPDGRVFSSGCMLDTSRLVRSIADYTGLSTGVVSGYMAGEHGDGQIPIWSRVTIGGIPIQEYCDGVGLPWNEEIRTGIADRVRGMGAKIIAAKGKTHYGIATCVCELADAVLNQRPTVTSVCSPLHGEHGVSGVALSVPSVVGPAGVQQRIPELWTDAETLAFQAAAEKIRATLQSLK
ncbi:MAG: L-lactate dehydrogenase [Eubacteriales bacterium]|nr:L-lactate dehydrogenase [Eubacteriales bacterium]